MKISVIIADAGDPDLANTITSVKDAGFTDIQIVKNCGVAEGRIQGVAQSDGDAYLFIDSHFRLPPKFREHCDRLLKGPDVIWQFRVEDINGAFIANGGNLVWCKSRLDIELIRDRKTEPFQCTAMTGACYLISRETYRRHGGWCPLFVGYGSNEEYFSARAHLLGVPIWCDPSKTVKHGYSLTPINGRTRDPNSPWCNRLLTIGLTIEDYGDLARGMGATGMGWTMASAKHGELSAMRNRTPFDDAKMLALPTRECRPDRSYHYAGQIRKETTGIRMGRGILTGKWMERNARKQSPRKSNPEPRRMGRGTLYPAGHKQSEIKTPTLPKPAKELPVVHLGSYSHEQWSVQHLVKSCVDREMSANECTHAGLFRRRVMCWHPHFWRAMNPERRKGNNVIMFFHHDVHHWIDDSQVIGGVTMGSAAAKQLRMRQPGKPVHQVYSGGIEDAIPHAERRLPTKKIRLLMAGNGAAGMPATDGKGGPSPDKRKGVELIEPIADRLHKGRYAWVFVGPKWEPYAEALAAKGWEVHCPGSLDSPEHYRWYGEADIYLMLARLEGGPMTTLETAGLGCWQIATPTGMIPDIIEHGRNGHILPHWNGDNVDAVANKAAQYIAQCSHSFLDAKKSVVKESLAEYTWDNFRKRMENVWKETWNK